MKKVVIGMSGGVDSSVSALLLKEAGYSVVSLFMKNWDEEDASGQCQATKDFEDVARVSEQLGIPYYSVDFAEEYWNAVFEGFLADLKKGLTPNPDVLCNREIKFKTFFEKAMSLGADFLATGHYCQTAEGKLLRGSDPAKDQSYFLHAVEGTSFEKTLFPIGHLSKKEVRRIAKEHGLPTSEKRDSTGICFIGKRNFKDFIQKYISPQPGEIVTVDGKIVGTHEGVFYYTIGQRKGMGIGGPGDAWFIADKDIPNNRLIVAQGSDHPALYRSTLTATNPHWIKEVPTFPLRCTAKIRYRQQDQACTVTPIDGALHVSFDTPQRAITPSQSVVFYQGTECLGGATISP